LNEAESASRSAKSSPANSALIVAAEMPARAAQARDRGLSSVAARPFDLIGTLSTAVPPGLSKPEQLAHRRAVVVDVLENVMPDHEVVRAAGQVDARDVDAMRGAL